MKLLQHLVDEKAFKEPDQAAFVVPKSERHTDDGFEDITNARFANAVNRAAIWLKENIRGAPDQVIAFIGPQDIRYLIFILASNKAGHKLMLLSPRNSDDAQRHLLGTVKCQYFLCGKQQAVTVQNIVSSTNGQVQSLEIPGLWDVLHEDGVEAVPFNATWDEARHQPFLVMHTSGTSTGKPKPIVLNHGYYAIEELLSKFPKIDGKALMMPPLTPGIRNCHAMPLFHVGALFLAFFKPVLQGGVVVFLPGDTQIEADLVVKTIKLGNCNHISTSPTIIENLLARSDGREILAELEQVGFGSGPMAFEVGQALLKLNRRCVNLYGSTEMELLPVLELDDPEHDWQYSCFHPWAGATMEPIGGDENMCELVVKLLKHAAYEALQSAFENWPGTDEYRSKDIFVRHPTKKDLWRWYSRADDVITFETGEKLNPSSMEGIISAHPKVKSAVIVGQRRMQPALLIEPVDHVSDHKLFLEDLWSTIQAANAEAPSYGRIVKQLVLFSEEPFRRTPKGTIQRSKTEEFLAQEIANLYEGGGESVYSATSKLTSQDNAQEFVRNIVHDVLDVPKDFDENTNLFDSGLDSLRAAELVRASNGVLKQYVTNGHAPPRIDVSTVYSDPTIKNLSTKIFNLASRGNDATEDGSWPESAKRLLSRHIPVLATGAAILTGSTGSLGAHLLHLLLHDQTYTHVYCLNRSDGAKKGYLDAFPSDNKLMHKATFLQTSAIWSPYFGLPSELFYKELLNSVRTIFHNAWPVNFLMAVEAANPGSYSSSFEPQLDGVANLLRFCAESVHKARLVYISSVSSVTGGKLRPVPEAIATDPSSPNDGGYPRSKWVTECIMDAVAREYPGTISQPVVIRPGQICGPLQESVEKGATGVGSIWNAREAISSIFISSSTVGALPGTIGHEEKLRWVPVDVVAKTTLEVTAHVDKTHPAGSINRDGASAWNVANIQVQDGKEVTWNAMTPVIQARLEKKVGKDVPIIKMEEWIQKVESFGGGDGKQNPAIKLLDFMGSLAATSADDGLGTEIETNLTKEASKSLRELTTVQPAWIEYWMDGWGL